MMVYRCKFFSIQELVHPNIHAKWGDRAWEFLDPRVLQSADQLREYFGPITINDWHVGGEHVDSGLREFLSTTGAAFSQHKFGRALDLKFKNTTPIGVASVITAQPSRFPFITTLEDVSKTITWLHIDVRNHDKQGIWIVNP